MSGPSAVPELVYSENMYAHCMGSVLALGSDVKEIDRPLIDSLKLMLMDVD